MQNIHEGLAEYIDRLEKIKLIKSYQDLSCHYE